MKRVDDDGNSIEESPDNDDDDPAQEDEPAEDEEPSSRKYKTQHYIFRLAN